MNREVEVYIFQRGDEVLRWYKNTTGPRFGAYLYEPISGYCNRNGIVFSSSPALEFKSRRELISYLKSKVLPEYGLKYLKPIKNSL